MSQSLVRITRLHYGSFEREYPHGDDGASSMHVGPVNSAVTLASHLSPDLVSTRQRYTPPG